MSVRRRRGRRLVGALLAVAILYFGVLGAAWLLQRRLTYFPDTRRVAPASVGLAGFRALTLNSDGEQIVAWWRPPPTPDAGVVLYFHGNGGNISYRADRLRDLANAGFGVLGIDYRG